MNINLDNLLVGKITSIGQDAVQSGIDKHSVDHRLFLGLEGFAEDEQSDRRYHGGPEKAVHHYPFEHYNLWQEDIKDCEILKKPGAFGENFSTTGMDESNVSVGDVFKVGGATLEVSQGRQPCWKLNQRFAVTDMAKRVQQTGRTGWYYRVIEEGYVEPGDLMCRIDRRSPEWTLSRLTKILYIDTMNYDELATVISLTHLTPSWRHRAEKRLKTRKVEDWSKRLEGDKSL